MCMSAMYDITWYVFVCCTFERDSGEANRCMHLIDKSQASNVNIAGLLVCVFFEQFISPGHHGGLLIVVTLECY